MVCLDKMLHLHLPNKNVAHLEMRKDLVSIIMPMHNSARYIGEAISSVIAQSYTDWELLVVDDLSTDNSVEIVKGYAQQDSRIHLLYNTRHLGMPSAPRSEGVKHAKGQYIAFLDSDDCWLPRKLEEQLPLFAAPTVAIVYSNYEKISENGERTGRVVAAPSQVDYAQMLYGNIIGNLTGIYDRAKTGLVPIPDVHHEDYAMWLSILKKGFIAKNTNAIHGLYRVMGSSVSSNKFNLLSWQWNIYRKTERLSLLKSACCYLHYAINAYRKRKI